MLVMIGGVITVAALLVTRPPQAMAPAGIEVRVPASVPPAELQAAPESLANELMVDLKLEAGA